MVVLVLAAGTFSACQASLLNSGHSPALRHPLFQRQATRPARQTSRLFDLTGAGAGAVSAPACRGAYLHPLLNRCWPQRHPAAAASRPRLTTGDLERGLRIAAVARKMLSRPRYRVGRISFHRDCSGFVLAVLAQSGYDTSRLLAGSRGTGATAALYRHLQHLGRVHRRRVPVVGDLVFFDNTYDRNGDGRANDPLTHVGVVEHVDSDGTVTFIHRVRRGQLRYRLNLFHPHLRRDRRSGKALNHPLRLGTPRHGKYSGLTGELFHAFATLPK